MWCVTFDISAEAGKSPTWNFWKYLVDGKGHVVNAWGPWVDVDDIKEAILDAVEEVIPLDLPYQVHHDDQEHEHEELWEDREINV